MCYPLYNLCKSPQTKNKKTLYYFQKIINHTNLSTRLSTYAQVFVHIFKGHPKNQEKHIKKTCGISAGSILTDYLLAR